MVLDSRPETVVERLRRLGISGFYGEVDRPEVLAAAGIAEARAVVMAIDEPEKAVRMVRHDPAPASDAAAHRPGARPASRLRADRGRGDRDGARGLRPPRCRPGGIRWRRSGTATAEIDAALAEFARQDQRMLDELAALWRPDVSAEENAAYLAMERRQAAVIEAALRAAVARGKET